jgi:hypothetical protein
MIVADLCCGAGGATRGYVDVGHEVWGIDIAPQPNYQKSGRPTSGRLTSSVCSVSRG